MAFRTSGLGAFFWSCCLDGLSNSVSPSPIRRELLCHICLFICSSLALESFSAFFFFKVKIGLAAEATRDPQFLRLPAEGAAGKSVPSYG